MGAADPGTEGEFFAWAAWVGWVDCSLEEGLLAGQMNGVGVGEREEAAGAGAGG